LGEKEVEKFPENPSKSSQKPPGKKPPSYPQVTLTELESKILDEIIKN
jgi:hypothetical protein